MGLYNLFSCKGFGAEAIEKTTLQFGECSSARLTLVALFFINALVRKWGGEEMGINYDFWLGFAGAFIGYLIPLTFTGKIGISFVIGIVLMLIGGYFGGSVLGGGGDEYD